MSIKVNVVDRVVRWVDLVIGAVLSCFAVLRPAAAGIAKAFLLLLIQVIAVLLFDLVLGVPEGLAQRLL